MKNLIGLIVLVIICVGLGIALITIKKQAADKQTEDARTIETWSNKWTSTSKDLDEQRTVATELQKDLSTEKKALDDLTNNFVQVSGNLAKTEASLEASQKELAKRDA